MAKYGIDFYGVGHYGATPFVEFDVSPVIAVDTDHGSLLITWNTPSGHWNELLLVRSDVGYPMTTTEGTTLLDEPSTSPVSSYHDIGLVPGKFYYYTLFVFSTDTNTWVVAGNVIGLTTKDYGYDDALFFGLPGIYQLKDAGTTGAGIYGAGVLQRYLQIFGRQLDKTRTVIDTLSWVNDPAQVSGGLLPLMAQQWGVSYESALGMGLARGQIANAVHLYKLKGTKAGIEGFTSVLTGWGATASLGVNLMLTQDDSHFATSLGRWIGTSLCNLARKNINTSPVLTRAEAAPPGPSVGNNGSGDWVMSMTSTNSGSMIAACGITGRPGNCIPVVAGTTYSYRGKVWTGATRTCEIDIIYYDVNGTFISGGGSAPAAIAAGAWTLMSGSTLAPAGARWAVITVTTTASGVGEIAYWTAFQINAGVSVLPWEPSRDTRLTLRADRVNYITNPSAEVDTAGWTSYIGAVTRVNTPAPPVGFNLGSWVFKTTPDVGTADESGGKIAITPGLPAGTTVAVSAWVYCPRTSARIYLRDQANNDTFATFTVTVVANTWTRIHGVATVPVSRNLELVYISPCEGVTANTEFGYWDGVLLEIGSAVGTYFDGATSSTEAEYVWAGTAMASRTHYYSRRTTKNYRLNARLGEVLPAGATYTLLYAT